MLGVFAYRRSAILTGLLVGLGVLICLGIINAAVSTSQNELIEKVEILEDPTAALTVDQIQTRAFSPANRVILIGYSSSAFWIRLHVRPVPNQDYYKLTVRPTSLDEITMYAPDPTEPLGWRVTYAGGLNRLIDPHLRFSSRAFRINPAMDGRLYLVRVASKGALGVEVSALLEADADRVALMRDMFQISYLCLMLALMIWAIRLALLTDEILLWLFAAMQAAWIAHNTIHFGYVDVFIPINFSGSVYMVNRGLVILASILTTTFHRTMLARFTPPRLSLMLLDALYLIYATSIILFISEQFSLALGLNAIAIGIGPLLLLVNVFTARQNAPPGLLTLKVIYSLFNLALSSWVLIFAGLWQGSTYAQWALFTYGLASGALMGSFLLSLSRHMLTEAEQAKSLNIQLEMRTQLEHAHNLSLMKFIDMLTHETKNAMAVISLSSATPGFGPRQLSRVNVAISNLTSVIERCSQALRMDMRDQVVACEPCVPASILTELCQANPSGARIQLTIQPDTILHSDPVLLKVIFGNLIENALKYSPPDSIVHVAMLPKTSDQQVIWFENDAGSAGLPDPAHVFEKYYRSSRAMSQIGSGIGLYLVKGLAHNLGGEIRYEPEGGRARFRLWLPC